DRPLRRRGVRGCTRRGSVDVHVLELRQVAAQRIAEQVGAALVQDQGRRACNRFAVRKEPINRFRRNFLLFFPVRIAQILLVDHAPAARDDAGAAWRSLFHKLFQQRSESFESVHNFLPNCPIRICSSHPRPHMLVYPHRASQSPILPGTCYRGQSMTASSFESLGLSEKTLALLKKKGFEDPTPIQALAIPLLLTGERDLVARARTGTGKTAAFGLPLVERLSEPCPHLRALVLVPTRELAIQVHAEIASLRHGAHPRTVAVYGGQAISLQMRSLERGVDVVVGTPGRVIDMIQRGKLDLSYVEYLVLDEADEMLDMGFAEEINAIFEAVNPERRVLMFSATMQDAVMRVARTRLRNFTTIEDQAKAEATELTEQIWLEVREQDKMEALTRIVEMEEDFYGLVFARTRVDADRIGQSLEERGYPVETLHGDY